PGSLPRPGCPRARAGAAQPAQGALVREEAPAAQGARPARAPGDPEWAQARLLDPGRSVAPQGARADGPRDPVAGVSAAPGGLPPRAGERDARRPRRRQAGAQAAAMEPACLLVVARPLRERRRAGLKTRLRPAP